MTRRTAFLSAEGRGEARRTPRAYRVFCAQPFAEKSHLASTIRCSDKGLRALDRSQMTMGLPPRPLQKTQLRAKRTR